MSGMTRDRAIEIFRDDASGASLFELAEAVDMAIEALKEQRPHGEWRTTPNPNHSPFDSTSEVIYMCSECAYSSGERIATTWHFCPNCGADMRKENQ